MFNELSEKDIFEMEKEIDYRIAFIRPKISKDIVEAKAHGDLSENAEYHAARREKGINEGRIEYLRLMIKTAKVVHQNNKSDEVGIFDKVEVFFEEDNESQTVQISTTMRNDPSKGVISKESPFGQAILGKRKGDKVEVKVNKEYSYHVVIKSIIKLTSEDINIPIS
ncbi:MAG: transcription elongation factor GreA [Clostridia bacterium]|nr:transcription elongation factor GreA [Clostridia bacterium]